MSEVISSGSDARTSPNFDKDFDKYCLDMPLVYQFAHKLIEQGYHIDVESIKNTETLAKAIKEGRSRL